MSALYVVRREPIEAGAPVQYWGAKRKPGRFWVADPARAARLTRGEAAKLAAGYNGQQARTEGGPGWASVEPA